MVSAVRLQAVRDYVYESVSRIADAQTKYSQFAHANGVAVYCTLLAMKRGFPLELAAAAALLHDIAFIRLGTYEDHAQRGAVYS